MTTSTPHPIQLKASETYLLSIAPLTPAQALGVPEDGPTMSLIQQWIDTKITEAVKELKSDFKDELENFDYGELASNIEVSDIADRISASSVAQEMDLSDIADEINLTDLGAEIDLSALASVLDLENMINYRHLAVALINHLREAQAKP